MDLSLFFVGVGLITGFLLITIVFAIREKRTGRRVYFLKEATALGSLTGITNVMVSGPELDFLNLGPTVILRFTIALWILTFALLGLFFMSMRQETLEWRVTLVMVALGTVSIVTGFSSLVSPSLQGNPLALAWKSSFALYSTTVFLYGASVYAGANKKLPEPRSAALAIVLIAISLSYVANMFFYDVPNYFGFSVLPGINLEVMLDFLRIILVAAIVVTLASDMEYFYRIPIDLYSISVIQASSGVCAYSYVRDPESANPELFASAITAISMFMKETSKSSSALKSIKTGSRTIMVEGREEDGFIVMAVVERSSLVLVRSLHMFADLFAEKYRGKVRDEVIIAQDYTDADLMIYIAFPFLKR